jgi:hypothetical protein
VVRRRGSSTDSAGQKSTSSGPASSPASAAACSRFLLRAEQCSRRTRPRSTSTTSTDSSPFETSGNPGPTPTTPPCNHSPSQQLKHPTRSSNGHTRRSTTSWPHSSSTKSPTTRPTTSKKAHLSSAAMGDHSLGDGGNETACQDHCLSVHCTAIGGLPMVAQRLRRS